MKLYNFLIFLYIFTEIAHANPLKALQAKFNNTMSESELEKYKIKLEKKEEIIANDRILSKKRQQHYYYTYIERDHTFEENLNNISAVYGLTWIVYPLTQPSTVKDSGSLKNYRKNFGQLVFDKDEPFWNWFVHPISGSQLYLFYRARGYSRSDAMTMSFISSSLFEFTVEIYTEPASIQDLYQTPVLGSVLGLGLEKLSLYLLNSGNLFGKVIGHTINPSTLFWFYEGKIKIIPEIGYKRQGLRLFYEF